MLSKKLIWILNYLVSIISILLIGSVIDSIKTYEEVYVATLLTGMFTIVGFISAIYIVENR